MRKFSINISKNLIIWYNHYLNSEFIDKRRSLEYFKKIYPLSHYSRGFDKPAEICKEGNCFWWLNDKEHRMGKPARIYSSGVIYYYENGKRIK